MVERLDKGSRQETGRGVRKVWVYNEKTGAFVVKTRRGGINWYRY